MKNIVRARCLVDGYKTVAKKKQLGRVGMYALLSPLFRYILGFEGPRVICFEFSNGSGPIINQLDVVGFRRLHEPMMRTGYDTIVTVRKLLAHQGWTVCC